MGQHLGRHTLPLKGENQHRHHDRTAAQTEHARDQTSHGTDSEIDEVRGDDFHAIPGTDLAGECKPSGPTRFDRP